MITGDVTYYSIDPTQDSVFATQTVDDFTLVEAKFPKDLVKWIWRDVITNVVGSMLDTGAKDFVIHTLPQKRGLYNTTEFTAIGIPGEHDRLLRRIDELERQLEMYKRFPRFDFKVD